MARRGIAVQVERSGGFQHAVQFQHPHGHHGQIGHHRILAQKGAHGAQHLGGGTVGRAQHLGKGGLGLLAPLPCVVKRLDLRGAVIALRPLEQHVVRRVRIEGRIEIDQIDR